jgi:sulfhydrogenase subunit gamma (sulfur reductase)
MSQSLLKTCTSASAYLPITARIAAMRPLTKLEKLFTVELPGGISLNHSPGQFVELSVFGVGEAPFSISSSPSRSNGTFELCVRRAGRLTTALHGLRPGDPVGIRGPFGQGFPLRRFQGKDLLFLPGGLGLAPLRSLINEVLDDRSSYDSVIILYGARHPSELLFQDELALWRERGDVELLVTVDRPDESWSGHVGVITTLIPLIQLYGPNTVAFVVGPPVMYRFVLLELLAKGVRDGNIWLSLERQMKCGIGKCGHCQINDLYTCRDGPCLTYAQIKRLGEAL